MRACVRACVRACACARARVCVRTCMCVSARVRACARACGRAYVRAWKGMLVRRGESAAVWVSPACCFACLLECLLACLLVAGAARALALRGSVVHARNRTHTHAPLASYPHAHTHRDTHMYTDTHTHTCQLARPALPAHLSGPPQTPPDLLPHQRLRRAQPPAGPCHRHVRPCACVRACECAWRDSERGPRWWRTHHQWLMLTDRPTHTTCDACVQVPTTGLPHLRFSHASSHLSRVVAVLTSSFSSSSPHPPPPVTISSQVMSTSGRVWP